MHDRRSPRLLPPLEAEPVVAAAGGEARELAMSRMSAEAARDGAEGVVGVRFNVHNYVWGIHTLEFYVDGTAIRPMGEAATITPSFTLPMS